MLPDDLKRITEHRDTFDLDLPWGWILAVIVAVCLVLDRIGAWVVK